MIAEIVAGRWQILEELGRGGSARTFGALDLERKRPVVVKRLALGDAAGWKAIELFEREGAVLQSLDHPAIPRFVAAFSDAGCYWLVQERVEGESLDRRITSGVRFDEKAALALARRVLEVLSYLHSRAPSVVHRDVKPSNLLLQPDGSISLVDFGAAQALAPLDRTGGSTVVGTYGYMAPEQFAGRAAPQSDLYALGATLLFLFSGRHPLDHEQRGLRFDLDALDVQPAVRLFLAHLLEPAPEERFQSAAEAIAWLDHFSAGKELTWHRQAPTERIYETPASWLTIEASDDIVTLQSPPLRTPQRALALFAGAGLLLGAISAVATIGFWPALVLGAAGLFTAIPPLFGAHLRIDRGGFRLRREILGIPFSIRRGAIKTMAIDEERAPDGTPLSSVSVWDGYEETRLADGLSFDEKELVLERLGQELYRLRGLPGGTVREPLRVDLRALPLPRRAGARMRLNLLPVRL